MTNRTPPGTTWVRVPEIWEKMHDRCENITNPEWHMYGGRGLTVCRSWFDFVHFCMDMGPRPLHYTLDRIEAEDGFHKGNCRWASKTQRIINKSNTIWLTYEGRTQTASDWCRERGLCLTTVTRRWQKQWPVEKILAKR